MTQNTSSRKESIRKFVKEQLEFADKSTDIDDDTPLITSGLLDSLILVDLLLFLETQFVGKKIELENIKLDEVDTINKIEKFMDKL